MSHPETGEPWWATQSLLEAPSSTGTSSKSSLPAPKQNGGSPAVEGGPPQETPTRKALQRIGPTAYVAAREDLLAAFTAERRTPYKGRQKALGRRSALEPEVLNRTVWRDDMPSFILELMRRRIVEQLLCLARLCEDEGRKYITKLGSWDDIKDSQHRGCVLWLPPGGQEPKGGNGVSVTGRPAEYATFDVEGARFDRKLLVYDLSTLLGQQHTDRLRQDSSILAEGSLFLLGRQRTIQLQLKLWKLLGYTATFRAPT